MSVNLAIKKDAADTDVVEYIEENTVLSQCGTAKSFENYSIDIPNHLQTSLDNLLDYYAASGKKPTIQLCGSPFDIITDFITQIETSLPENLLNNGKDLIDYIINSLCEFCREKSITHMTYQFTFLRNDRCEIQT